MNTSQEINEIAKALAKVQASLENAGKNAVNPHFKNKYADLAEVLNVVRPALAANDIALTQLTSTQGDVLVLHTRLIHASGQWLESEYPVCKLPMAPQQMGSAMTYARRYSLASVSGIAQEDDDLADGKGTHPVDAPKKSNSADAKAKKINIEIETLRERVFDTLAAMNTVAGLTTYWKDIKTSVPVEIRDEMIEAFSNRKAEIEAITSEAAE